MTFTLPKLPRGRWSNETKKLVQQFADNILEIDSTLDFVVSARGWCYLLENEYGLLKSDFDGAQRLITECRKRGYLPLDITATDDAREFNCLEKLDEAEPEDEAERIKSNVESWVDGYTPHSFWDSQDVFIQMLVEKVDLRSLFEPVCRKYRIPIANSRGWSDLHTRAEMIRRWWRHSAKGRRPVLLYCGDHDPSGVCISDTLRKNIAEVVGCTYRHGPSLWLDMDELVVDRFGLNADFIEENDLSKVENLMTSSGQDLADPTHKHHEFPYVQDYLTDFGEWKCEANALVTRPDQGRELCEDAILAHLSGPECVQEYEEGLEPARDQLRELVQFEV